MCGGSRPSAPAAPPPPPKPVQQKDVTDVTSQAVSEQRNRASKAFGQSASVLTGGLGETMAAQTKKTVLGG